MNQRQYWFKAINVLLVGVLLTSVSPALARAPRQYSWLTSSLNPLPVGGTTILTASVSDPDGDPVTVTWTATYGTLSSNTGFQVALTVPDTGPGTVTVTATADDGQGGTATDSMTLLIVADNVAPFISINANPLVVRLGRTSVLTASVNDPNGDAVAITWTTTAGTLSSASGPQVILTAPLDGRELTVTATADDGKGGRASASLVLLLIPRNLPPTIRIDANPSVIRAPLR